MLHAKTLDLNVYDTHVAYESRPSAPRLADRTVLKARSPRRYEMSISISTSQLIYAHSIRHSKNASVLRLLICDAGNFEVKYVTGETSLWLSDEAAFNSVTPLQVAVFFHAFCDLYYKLDTSPRPDARETNFRPTKTLSGDFPLAHLSQKKKTSHVP